MIRLVISIGLCLCLLSYSSQRAMAAVETDTHLYMITNDHYDLLIIDRQTGVEKTLPMGHGKKVLYVYDQVGYVLCTDMNCVHVFDLSNHVISKTVPLSDSPQSMDFALGNGYIRMKSKGIDLFDLKDVKITQTYLSDRSFLSLAILMGCGFALSDDGKRIYVFSCGTGSLRKVLSLPRVGTKVIALNRSVIVLSTEAKVITTINATRQYISYAISLNHYPESMVVHQGYGYVLDSTSLTLSIISTIRQCVVGAIQLTECPSALHIHNGFAYAICRKANSLLIIDLLNRKQLGSMNWDPSVPIDFSDTHMYAGLRKDRPLFPSEHHITKMKKDGELLRFVRMDPNAFNVNENCSHRPNCDKNPLEVLGQATLNEFFLDDQYCLKIDAVDALSLLLTFRSPVEFLKSPAGIRVRELLHLRLFQIIWLGNSEDAKKIVYYFVQLGDPLIMQLVYASKNVLSFFEFSEPLSDDLGDLIYEDPEKAFCEFEEYLRKFNFKDARRSFEVALFHCHPKACAIASYVYAQKKEATPEITRLWMDYLMLSEKDYPKTIRTKFNMM